MNGKIILYFLIGLLCSMTVTANGKEKERLFIIMQDNMPPFGGMGLLKTENGQIIREYKIPNGQSVDIEEAAMYMIDKNGTHRKVAIFNGKQWKKDKELYDANTSKI